MKNYHSSLKRKKNQDVITISLRVIFVFKNKKGSPDSLETVLSNLAVLTATM